VLSEKCTQQLVCSSIIASDVGSCVVRKLCLATFLNLDYCQWRGIVWHSMLCVPTFPSLQNVWSICSIIWTLFMDLPVQMNNSSDISVAISQQLSVFTSQNLSSLGRIMHFYLRSQQFSLRQLT